MSAIHRTTYNWSIVLWGLSEYTRFSNRSLATFAEFTTTTCCPNTLKWTSGPWGKNVGEAQRQTAQVVPYFCAQRRYVSQWADAGTSLKFPMIGSGFGPGGYGSPCVLDLKLSHWCLIRTRTRVSARIPRTTSAIVVVVESSQDEWKRSA